MTDLHEKNCIPCRGGVPPFDISEIHKYLKKIDGWDVKKNKVKFIFLKKILHLKIFLKVKNLSMKLVVLLNHKGIIQI